MRGVAKPRKKELTGIKHYRIVPSRYPTIQLFEQLVDPDELEILFEIESMTNDRLREDIGELSLVPVEDRITGAGASPVMAAFTHINQPSRFTDGSYGVYYAGLSLKTAVLETSFHREIFLASTKEKPCEIEMRSYAGKIQVPLHNIAGKTYIDFQSTETNTYTYCQQFAANIRSTGSDGLYYKSARDIDGLCVALFKPIAVGPVIQSKHFIYLWDGQQIADILEVKKFNQD